MMRPGLRSHAFDHWAAHLNSELRLVLMTAFQFSGVMRWNMASRVMPALFTRTSTGSKIGLNCLTQAPSCEAGYVDAD